MDFNAFLIGGFVTYMVIKYAENTWKAEPMDIELIEEVIEQHMEGRAMIREKNREMGRVRRDLRVARKLRMIDDEIEEGREELEELGYHTREETPKGKTKTTKRQSTPVQVDDMDSDEDEGATIHIYSRPVTQTSNKRKQMSR